VRFVASQDRTIELLPNAVELGGIGLEDLPGIPLAGLAFRLNPFGGVIPESDDVAGVALCAVGKEPFKGLLQVETFLLQGASALDLGSSR
jgi:hypothetical protein